MNRALATLLIFKISSLAAVKMGWGHDVPLDIITKIIPKNPIILEAGAHYAQDTRWLAQMWPNGVVHAFEPTPRNFLKVQTAAQELVNIKCYKYALDKQCGVKTFYQDGDEDKGNEGANSLLPHKLLKKSSKPPIKVECITIDKWALDNSIDHIDFIWMDIEGNELNALKGAENILPTVKAIFTEVNFREFWHGCVLYDTLSSWLNERGFKEVWKDVRPNWNGNVLFVRK